MRLGPTVVALAAVVALGARPAAAAPARIAFSTGNDLYTMLADGSARTQLTALGPGRSAYGPAWSPDGSRLAFSSETESGASRIWTVASDGAGAGPLTPPLPRHSLEYAPTWSPDGTSIAFARLAFMRDSLRTSIVVTDTDGGQERTVRSALLRRLGFFAPSGWAPDGSTLLFTRSFLDRRGYFKPSIYSIGADGGGERLIARAAEDGSYAPDGSRIAFSSVRDRNGTDCGSDECSYRSELYVMRADGSGMKRLTRTKAREQHPVWSPDGARIAFSSDRNYPAGENPELYSVEPDGGCLTWLTNGSLGSSSPAWEPGASLSSDPGACGAVERAPLLGVDPSGTLAGRHFRFRPYWLGQTFARNLLLSDASSEYSAGRGLDLSYSDCSSFDPAACSRPVLISETSTCADHPLMQAYGSARRLRVVAGVLVFRGIGHNFSVFAGTSAISVYGAPQESLARFLRALRPVGAAAPPARLPAPVFGRKLWERLARAVRARRRLGSVAAAALSLHLRPRIVRKRLLLERRLRAAGAGRRRCAPGDRPL
jgi:Tol biopolymer transport system component